VIENLRYAVRQLFRAPTFTIVTILTLALGVEANTAIFSVIQLSHSKMPDRELLDGDQGSHQTLRFLHNHQETNISGNSCVQFRNGQWE
jgi:hypothetical protein